MTSIEMYEKYKGVVYKYAKKYGKYDYEEVLQDGFLALMKAIKKLDGSKTKNPMTFITEWVKWEMYTTIKKQGNVNYFENDVFDEEFYTTEDDFDTKLTLSDIISRTKLSPRQKDVLDCMLDGMTLQQMASKLDKNLYYIRNVREKVLKKLRETAKARGYINE